MSRPGRWRGAAALTLVVVGSLSLALGLAAGWAQRSVFDDGEFATRVVSMLDSRAVRHELAIELTNEIIEKGSSQLASYRTPLIGIVEDVMTTDGFRSIFRGAVAEAHRAVFQRNSAAALLELGETLRLVSANSGSGGGLSASLPSAAGSLLIDVTPTVRRLELWRFANDLRWLDELLLGVTAATFVGAVAIDRRRLVFVAMGIGVAAGGVAIVVATDVIPDVAAATVDDAALADAIGAGVRRFLIDLRMVGLWTIPFGIVLGAAAEASRGEPRLRIGAWFEWARRHRYASLPRPGQLALGAAAVAGGIVLLVARERLVSLAILLAGIYVVFVGAVLFIRALLGPEPEPDHARSRSRRAVLATAAAIVGVLLVGGLTVNVTTAASSAREREELVCNGSADLCDRRLDEVAFAGSHNSMSAEADPGWLFAENLYGVPAQLQYGIRALLVKSHYGIDSGIALAGVKLVVTDKAAEIHQSAAEEASELGPDAVQTVEDVQRRIGPVSGRPELYLCHGYCELGATKLSEVLASIRSFVQENPHDVIIMIIGDFVTPEDTQRAFRQAGLGDRLWTYDPGKRPPTLGRMIRAKRNLLVLSEHGGGTPPWYGPAYLTADAVFQDTPFTFATPSEFSCAPNRGRPESPLFQINHWITNTSPPNAEQAQSVNSYGTLMGRVRECAQERGRFPTVVGVNFYDRGDLLRVVDDLNRTGKVEGG